MDFCETMRFFQPKGAEYAVYKETIERNGIRQETIYYFDDINDAGIFFTRMANEYVHMLNDKKDVIGYKANNIFIMRADTERTDELYGGLMLLTKDTQDMFVKLVVVENPNKFIR